jgi:ribonuclease D
MPRRRPDLPPSLPEQVVDRPALLNECLDHLHQAPVLGFDTEFVGEDSYRPELCLVQVATAERLYLLDPLGCGPLDRFWELLLDPGRTIVVHAGREEVRMCRHAIGRPPHAVFDVQVAAGLVGFNYPIGYAGLVQELLGARAHKGETLTDWRRRPLTPSQMKYAFDDVRFLLPVWNRLTELLRRHGRTDWADEEFAAFVRWAVTDEPSIEKWRKLKGLGGLNRRELAVVRAVFEWREDLAARINRPPRFILRDDLIVEIGRRTPTRAEEIQSLRGLPHREVEPILEAVRRALVLPPGELPVAVEREFDPPHVVTLSTLLGVALAEWCARMRLAPNLVATTQDLKALVRARQPGGPAPATSSLASGWRDKAVRPHLEAILDGTTAIRVVNPASPTPIALHPLGDEPGPTLPEARSESPDEPGVEV